MLLLIVNFHFNCWIVQFLKWHLQIPCFVDKQSNPKYIELKMINGSSKCSHWEFLFDKCHKCFLCDLTSLLSVLYITGVHINERDRGLCRFSWIKWVFVNHTVEVRNVTVCSDREQTGQQGQTGPETSEDQTRSSMRWKKKAPSNSGAH